MALLKNQANSLETLACRDVACCLLFYFLAEFYSFYSFFLCIFLFMSFTPTVANEEQSMILGSWEYMAQEGYGAQSGTVTFTVKDNVLVGNVNIGGQIIPMRNLVFENGRVRAYIFIVGIQVDLYLKFKPDYSFEGTVSNSTGYMKVEGCKKHD